MKHDIKIGADPELMFQDQKTQDIVTAADVLSDEYESAGFGLDGGMEAAEIRPTPSTNPAHVVKSIHNIMIRKLRSNTRMRNLNWLAGSFRQHPIGGHIHFGTRAIDHQERDREGDCQQVSDRLLAGALDRFLAPLLLLIEDETEARSRRRDYGRLGDWREQNHGMEYRTPSSWLVSQPIALATLSLAKIIAHDVMINPKSVYRGLSAKELTALKPSPQKFNTCDKKYFYRRVPLLMKYLVRMKSFKQYAQFLQPLFELIKKKQSWYAAAPDVKTGWNLPQVPVRRIPQHAADEVWSRF